jgi:hypothetical protein
MTADKAEAIIEQGPKCPTRPRPAEPRCHRQLQEGQPVPQGEAADHPGRQGHDGIDVNKDQPRYDQPVAGGNVPIDTKHVKTDVVVENGGTVVIGGIYIQEVGNNTTKIPCWATSRCSATCSATTSARTTRPNCSSSSRPASSTISLGCVDPGLNGFFNA